MEADQYKSMGVPEEKIAVIPNGIDLSEMLICRLREPSRRSLTLPEDGKINLYLSRIHKKRHRLSRHDVRLSNKRNEM